MDKRHIFVDDKELVLIVEKKKGYDTINLTTSQVTRIKITSCKIRKYLFMIKQTDCIKIYTNRRHKPIIFIREKEKEYFDEYIEQLQEFARNNRITCLNNL